MGGEILFSVILVFLIVLLIGFLYLWFLYLIADVTNT